MEDVKKDVNIYDTVIAKGTIHFQLVQNAGFQIQSFDCVLVLVLPYLCLYPEAGIEHLLDS